MKKLVLVFVAFAAMSFASCSKTEKAPVADTTQVQNDSLAGDSLQAAGDSIQADSVK